MKTIVIASQKGGVGKTTLTMNLGYALARLGWRTLVVDADPQGAIGLSLNAKVSRAVGLFDYLMSDVNLADIAIQTRLDELTLVPIGQLGVRDAPRFRDELARGVGLSRLLSEAESIYDLVMIDTPGGLCDATLGVLRLTDHVLCPVQAEPVAVRSIPQFLETLAWMRESGVNVNLLGLVMNMVVMDDAHSRTILDEIRKLFPTNLVMRTIIPRDNIYLKATAAGVPLALLSRRSPPPARRFEELAREVESRLDLRLPDDGPISLLD